MKVRLGDVLRECKRRGISFADDNAEAIKACLDLAREAKNLERKFKPKFSAIYKATYGTNFYSDYVWMTQALMEIALYGESLARKLKK